CSAEEVWALSARQPSRSPFPRVVCESSSPLPRGRARLNFPAAAAHLSSASRPHHTHPFVERSLPRSIAPAPPAPTPPPPRSAWRVRETHPIRGRQTTSPAFPPLVNAASRGGTETVC